MYKYIACFVTYSLVIGFGAMAGAFFCEAVVVEVSDIFLGIRGDGCDNNTLCDCEVARPCFWLKLECARFQLIRQFLSHLKRHFQLSLGIRVPEIRY